MQRIGRVDLLLTDLILGDGYGGLELTEELKVAHPEMKHIIMTGYAEENRTQAIDATDIPVLAKPFRLASLEKAISEALSG